MEKLGIIEKETMPTDWVNSLVIVHKANGKLCIRIDLRDLNKATKRQHVQLPSVEELFAQMSGVRYLVHWICLMHTGTLRLMKKVVNSSLLLHLLEGINIFDFLLGFIPLQRFVSNKSITLLRVLRKYPISGMILVIIWGKTREELHQSLKEVLQRVQISGMKLNLSKCKFEATEMSYLGHKVSETGIRPDANKLAAIVEMPELTNKTELQRFLGMIKYLG